MPGNNADWGVPSPTLFQPFNGPPDIVIFPFPIPVEIINAVHAALGATWSTIEAILYRKSTTQYWFDALAVPSSPTTFGDYAICRGAINSTTGIVSQIWSYSGAIGGTRHRLGTQALDLDIQIGDPANAGITITKNPLTIPSVVTIGAGIGGGTNGVINLEAGTGAGTINLTAPGNITAKSPFVVDTSQGFTMTNENLAVNGSGGRIIPKTGTVVGTTDASGFLTFFHALGATPTAVLVTPQAPSAGTVFSQVLCDTIGATTARIRAISNVGNAIVTTSVTFRYAAFGV